MKVADGCARAACWCCCDVPAPRMKKAAAISWRCWARSTYAFLQAASLWLDIPRKVSLQEVCLLLQHGCAEQALHVQSIRLPTCPCCKDPEYGMQHFEELGKAVMTALMYSTQENINGQIMSECLQHGGSPL